MHVLRAAKEKNPWGKKEQPATFSGPCPCASRLPYATCCKPLHEGQWAKTALELALARYSSRNLGIYGYLSSTTHPEALDLVGGTSQLEKKAERLGRRYKELQVKMLDACSGPMEEEGKEKAWIVGMALEFDIEQGRDKSLMLERYVQVDGKWLYWGSEDDVPTGGSFSSFTSKHWDGGEAQEGEESEEQKQRNRAGPKPGGGEWQHTYRIVRPVHQNVVYLDDYSS